MLTAAESLTCMCLYHSQSTEHCTHGKTTRYLQCVIPTAIRTHNQQAVRQEQCATAGEEGGGGEGLGRRGRRNWRNVWERIGGLLREWINRNLGEWEHESYVQCLTYIIRFRADCLISAVDWRLISAVDW